MPKAEDQLSSGDAIVFRGTKKFLQLANPKIVKQPFTFTIPDGETASGLRVEELRSPNDRIYTLLGIDLELDFEFGFKINDRDMFFTEADGILRYRDAPPGTPFAMWNWLFETVPKLEGTAPQFSEDVLARGNFYLIDWKIFQLEDVPQSATPISVNS